MNKGWSEGLGKGVNRKLEEKEGILFTLKCTPFLISPTGERPNFELLPPWGKAGMGVNE
jgi:hypothetical protein